jgi:hypothetical protein
MFGFLRKKDRSPDELPPFPPPPPVVDLNAPVTGAEFLEKRKAMVDVKYTDLPIEVREAFFDAEREASRVFDDYVGFSIHYKIFNRYNWSIYTRIFSELGWMVEIRRPADFVHVTLKPKKEKNNEL